MKKASAVPAASWGRPILLGGGLGLGIALLDALARTIVLHDAALGRPFLYHLMIDIILFGGLGAIVFRVWGYRRQTEDQLRKLSRAVEQSASTVVITDLDGNIEYANPRFTMVTGYTLDEVRGQNPRILKSGEMPPQEYEHLWETITAGGEWRGEFHNVRKNGELFWELASISPIKNADGVITHFLAVKEDITARKLAETAEREQRALAEALRDIATAISTTLDLDVILDRLLTHLGSLVPHDGADVMYIRDGVASVVRVCEHFSPDDAAALLALRLPVAETPHLQTMAETGEPLLVGDMASDPYWAAFPFARTLRSYIGVPFWSSGAASGFVNLYAAAPDFYTADHLERLRAFADQAAVAIQNAQMYDAMRDFAAQLSDRVAERTAELEQKQAQLQAILDSMAEGVAYVQDGHIRYTNPALVSMLGAAPGDLDLPTEQIFARYIHSVDSFSVVTRQANALFEQGRIWRDHVQVRRPDGDRIDAAMTVTPVYGPDGQRIGSVAMLRDVSQEKALQAQKDRFLANAAHELRTPISNIKTRLYLIRRQPEHATGHLDVLDTVAENMIGLVEDLLDVVRFGRRTIRLHRKPLVLQDLIRDVLAVHRPEVERWQIRLAVEMPGEPLTIDGDWRRLTQVVTRLILNAIHYSAEEGQVSVRLAAEAGHAAIHVLDSGPGIAPDQLPYIFQPFFRATEGGSEGLGLGLAIAQQIVELHGGTLAAESEIGRGSVFTVRLALVEDGVREGQPRA